MTDAELLKIEASLSLVVPTSSLGFSGSSGPDRPPNVKLGRALRRHPTIASWWSRFIVSVKAIRDRLGYADAADDSHTPSLGVAPRATPAPPALTTAAGAIAFSPTHPPLLPLPLAAAAAPAVATARWGSAPPRLASPGGGGRSGTSQPSVVGVVGGPVTEPAARSLQHVIERMETCASHYFTAECPKCDLIAHAAAWTCDRDDACPLCALLKHHDVVGRVRNAMKTCPDAGGMRYALITFGAPRLDGESWQENVKRLSSVRSAIYRICRRFGADRGLGTIELSPGTGVLHVHLLVRCNFIERAVLMARLLEATATERLPPEVRAAVELAALKMPDNDPARAERIGEARSVVAAWSTPRGAAWNVDIRRADLGAAGEVAGPLLDIGRAEPTIAAEVFVAARGAHVFQTYGAWRGLLTDPPEPPPRCPKCKGPLDTHWWESLTNKRTPVDGLPRAIQRDIQYRTQGPAP